MITRKVAQTILFFAIIVTFSQCKSSDNQKSEGEIKRISEMMDKAMESDNPKNSFIKLLPEIRMYNIVDSCWIDQNNVWIKFRDGGKLYWKIPSEQGNTNTIELNE